jgi:hypothetical protein
MLSGRGGEIRIQRVKGSEMGNGREKKCSCC